MHRAALPEPDSAIRFLSKSGTSVYAKNHEGLTASNLATMYCQTLEVKVLLGAGSAIEARTEDGYSALQLAVMKKTWSFIEV